jgi:hypothetical protein
MVKDYVCCYHSFSVFPHLLPLGKQMGKHLAQNPPISRISRNLKNLQIAEIQDI